MQTHAISAGTAPMNDQRARTRVTQKVVIVNGTSDVLEGLEPVLEAGNYDVVFVESSAHAYSQIRRVQPNLVILCIDIDDADGLNVLSMLKLDADTRDIPVLTYTSAGEDESTDQDDDPEPPMFTTRPVLVMN